MPILMNHYVMLQRNLVYIGITRTKKILAMVGTRKAVSYAVHDGTVTKGKTMLKEWLVEKGHLIHQFGSLILLYMGVYVIRVFPERQGERYAPKIRRPEKDCKRKCTYHANI